MCNFGIDTKRARYVDQQVLAGCLVNQGHFTAIIDGRESAAKFDYGSLEVQNVGFVFLECL